MPVAGNGAGSRVQVGSLEPSAGAASVAAVGAASPSALDVTTKRCGKRPYPSSGAKKSRDSSCALTSISRGDIAGARKRLNSHARSYSSWFVCRENHSPSGAWIASSSSSLALTLLNVVQSIVVSASAPGTPSAIITSASLSQFFSRAAPPRTPYETKPSRVGQISRVRPMFAPMRCPRWPLSLNPAIADMFATNTISCIEQSTTRPASPDFAHSPLSAANATSPAVCA